MIAKAAVLGAALVWLSSCSWGVEERGAGRRSTVVERPGTVAGVELYPVPSAVVEVCRSTQRQARIPILCPSRLPRPVRDLIGSSALPPAVLTAFAWDASGIDFSYSGETGRPRLDHPDRFFHLQVIEQDQSPPRSARPARLGGKSGLLAPASSGDYASESYFANHWRFFWTEGRVRYAATVHHFGPGTRRLLAWLVRDLRPAGSLRRRDEGSRPPGVKTIDVPVPGPVSVAADGDGVWVVGQGNRSVSGAWMARIDAHAGRVSGERIRIARGGGAPAVLADGPVWVVHRGLRRLDRDSRELTVPLDVRPELVALARAAGSLWLVDHGRSLGDRGEGVLRTDRAADEIVARIPVGRAPAGIAAGDGDLWVTSNMDDTVSRIDARTDRVVDTISVPRGPVGVAFGYGSVWVASHSAATLSRIDPRTNRIVDTIRVGSGPRAVAIGEHGVWVTNELDDTVSRVDPHTSRSAETIPVGAGPTGIATGSGAVWVANNHDETVTRIEP